MGAVICRVKQQCITSMCTLVACQGRQLGSHAPPPCRPRGAPCLPCGGVGARFRGRQHTAAGVQVDGQTRPCFAARAAATCGGASVQGGLPPLLPCAVSPNLRCPWAGVTGHRSGLRDSGVPQSAAAC